MDLNILRYELVKSYGWEHPKDYMGFEPTGDILLYTKTRDSSLLEESNFEMIYDALLNLGDDEAVYEWRADHWACGWVDYLMLKQNAPEAMLRRAYKIFDDLEGYPVFNEDDYSQRRYNAAVDCWRDMSNDERAYMCDEAGIDWPSDPEELPQEVEEHMLDTLFY